MRLLGISSLMFDQERFFNIPDAVWNIGYFIKKRGVIALYLYR
jgi:hypothetical protein